MAHTLRAGSQCGWLWAPPQVTVPLGQHLRCQTPADAPSVNIQPCLPNSLSHGPAKALGDCSLALIFNIFYSKLTKMSAFFLHFLEWSEGVFSPGSLQLLPWASLVRSCLSREVAPASWQVSSVACAHFATRRIAHCLSRYPWCRETLLSDFLLEMKVGIVQYAGS